MSKGKTKGGPVWDPGCQIDINNLGKIKRMGARFATGNYLMEQGNSKKNLDTLGWERLQTKLIIFHKVRLKLIDMETGQLSFKTRQTRMGAGEMAYSRPFSSVDSHIFSFFLSTVNIWNRLLRYSSLI